MTNIMDFMSQYAVLTYPNEFPLDGKIVKYHLQKLKQRLVYQEIRIFWFMEFQKRGAVHFNLLLDKDIEHEELSRMWYEIVGSNDPKHLGHGVYLESIRSSGGLAKYLAEYFAKIEQKQVPLKFQNVGRFWGYSLSLMPKITKIIIGTTEQMNMVRARLRMLRRWNKARRRLWERKARLDGWKPKKNKFKHFHQPNEYLTVRNAKRFIDELRSRGMDTSLFESSGEEPSPTGLSPWAGLP